MKFRIVYDGELFSSQPSENNGSGKHVKMAEHKHEIRGQMNSQLKNLLQKHPTLSTFEYCPECQMNHAFQTQGGVGGDHKKIDLTHCILENPLTVESNKNLGNDYFKFCPLVSKALGLRCSLDILLLREGQVAGVYKSGDLDNRLKTLIDGLTMPRTKDQIPEAERNPSTMTEPFYTLLADDNIIDSLKVETDTLYKHWSDNEERKKAWVTAIITVDVRPITPNFVSLSFI